MHHGDDLLPARCRADAEEKHLQARKSKTPHRKMLLFSDRAPGAGDSNLQCQPEGTSPAPAYPRCQHASIPPSQGHKTRHEGRQSMPLPWFRAQTGRTHASKRRSWEAAGSHGARPAQSAPAQLLPRSRAAACKEPSLGLATRRCQKAPDRSCPRLAPRWRGHRHGWPQDRSRERHACQIALALFRDTIENAHVPAPRQGVVGVFGKNAFTFRADALVHRSV